MGEPFRLVLETAPPVEPVTTAVMKSFLRVDHSNDDTVIDNLIKGARKTCENFTGRVLITQTWTMYRDDWPDALDDELWEGLRIGPDRNTKSRALEIPKPPLQSITHVKTYDDSDTATEWDSSNYFVDTASVPGRLVARVGQTFPVTTRAANGIEIQFVAGYDDDGTSSPDYLPNIPQDVLEGIKQMVAHLYENRGDEPEIAMKQSGARLLWTPSKVMRL